MKIKDLFGIGTRSKFTIYEKIATIFFLLQNVLMVLYLVTRIELINKSLFILIICEFIFSIIFIFIHLKKWIEIHRR